MMSSTSDHEEELRAALAQTLERSAVRQLATLRAASAAITYAPTLDDCAAALERARDEFEHLETSAEIYRELTSRELSEVIAEQAAALPLPTSWFEAALAQLVLCLAARVEAVDAGRERGLSQRVVHECEHVDAARAALRELCVSEAQRVPPERVDAWLKAALSSLAPPLRGNYLAALRGDIDALGVIWPAVSAVAA